MIRKILAIAATALAAAVCGVGVEAQPGVKPKIPTKTAISVWSPVRKHPDAKIVKAGGQFIPFTALGKIRTMKPGQRMLKLDEKGSKIKAKAVTLPIDWTKGFTIDFPWDGNDNFSDCYYAAGCHADNTWAGNSGASYTFGLGTFSTGSGTNTSILERYGYLSNGDNGLNDSDMQGEMMAGGVAPGQGYLANGMTDPTRTLACQVSAGSIVDWMQFDPTNATQTQAMLQRYGVCIVTFGVPDNWLSNRDTGAVWDAPATPNPANGHAVIWNGCRDGDGAYCLQTWGSYVWVTPAGVKDAQFQGWVAFSPRWFNAQGYAPNGEHIVDLASQWVADGGKQIPAAIISQFPPPTQPKPTPPGPAPLPGTYTLVVNPDGTITLTPVATPAAGATGTYTVNTDGSITLTPAAKTKLPAPKKTTCTDTLGKDLAAVPPTSIQRSITWWEKNHSEYATKP
jgi:hypothetical protein